MKVLVSGSTGLIGSNVSRRLRNGGHDVVALARRGTKAAGGAGPTSSQSSEAIIFDPRNEHQPESFIEELSSGKFDAFLHLAGDNIADGRWTEEKKRRIRDSRVRLTASFAEALSLSPNKPSVFAVASAVGFYGDRGDETLTESSSAGDGFLAAVCREWEEAAEKARQAGIRTVHLRFGVVLSSQGGALSKMLLPFKLGAGGPIGSGTQYMSWISADDAAAAIEFILMNDNLSGPVNVVSPQPVTNAGFSKALGRALNRPALMPMPALAVKTLFGEMGDECLLASNRVLPEKLMAAKFQYRHQKLDEALAGILSSNS